VMIAGTDGKAHQRKVKVGVRNKTLAEITSGIQEGDPVITAGGYALPDATKIKVEAPSEVEPDKDKVETGDKKEEAAPAAPAAKKPATPAKGKE
jgi:preprotein translocase subunit YajC